jgi:hypothetical protein
MSEEEDQVRYKAAMHAVQTGVAYKMQYDPGETSPKHLRTGVNSAMVETSALVQLLVDKGIITDGEWYKTLADFAERERDTYQRELSEHFGSNITLG